MICRQCGAAVAPDAQFCPGCGARQGTPAAPAPHAQPAASLGHGQATTVPLTDEQRNWLRINTVGPVVGVGVGLGALAICYVCVLGQFLNSPFVKILVGLFGLLLLGVAVATWLHVRNNLADLRLGAAEVRVARLLRRTTTGHSPRSFYLELDGVGSVTVMHDLYEGLVDGNLYRVTYSPHTRRGWSISEVPSSSRS